MSGARALTDRPSVPRTACNTLPCPYRTIPPRVSHATELPIKRPEDEELYEYEIEAVLPLALQSDAGAGEPPPEPDPLAALLGAGTPKPRAEPQKRVRVSDEASWQKLQRMMPCTPTDLMGVTLRSSAGKARSGAYVLQLQGGWTGWPLAVMVLAHSSVRDARGWGAKPRVWR